MSPVQQLVSIAETLDVTWDYLVINTLHANPCAQP